MKCPYCESENNHGEHFCVECGAELVANGSSTTSGNETTGLAAGLAPGASLQNGRYVIIRRLGEGGMGSVLLAKDTRLAAKQMVIKVLNAENSADLEKLQEDVRNFKREAETLAHLDHPLIPDVTDHFEEGMHYYMVMDYVPGENLEDWLDRNRQPMKEQDALRYTLEVLDILEYLSKQLPAIVHRDIKPANIIIGEKDRHAHLVDFGIARTNTVVNGVRRKTTALGTPGYAPPEQYQGFADPRSDLYALAATLHHLVTNRDPGENAPFQYPAARTLNKRVSPELEQILIKALKTSPNDRYQTAQEMRGAVEALLAGTTTIGSTDGYRLSDSVPLRALPPKPTPRPPVDPFDSAPDPFDSYGSATQTSSRRQQQQQSYYEPDYYPGRQPRQYNAPFGQRQDYRNAQAPQMDENQLMWRFIMFIVAIIMIGVVAYLLFSSLRFY